MEIRIIEPSDNRVIILLTRNCFIAWSLIRQYLFCLNYTREDLIEFWITREFTLVFFTSM